MPAYRFAAIVPSPGLSHDAILDATEVLGEGGCTDASVRGHANGLELLFERSADSLQEAISTAVADIERAGYRVSKVELERESMPA